MADRSLRRSTSDRQISGVCAGIAKYLDVDVGLVRIGAVVLLVFMSTPVLVGYVLAAATVPEDDAQPALDVTWGANSLRVTWKAATVPYSVSAFTWLGSLVGGAFLVLQLAALVVGAVYLSGMPALAETLFGVLMALFTFSWPLGLGMVLAALFPRPYSVTLTEGALWLERPMRSGKRIELGEIEDLVEHPSGVTLHLKDGALLRLPPPPQDDGWTTLVEETRRAQRRILQHTQDLAALTDERQELQELLERK
ncbi:MAG: PspC domain-containing protein [Myxococcales bacterium]|nr:PspC domain-containing protein [Myxococcales bacterium]